jgi:hypothetical protein
LKPIETKIKIIVDVLHTIISTILIYHIILGCIGVVGVVGVVVAGIVVAGLVVAGLVVANIFAVMLYSKHP